MMANIATDDRANLFDAVHAALLPRPGDVVTVRGGFGRETPERVTVIGVGEEMGQPVIDYVDERGRKRWAYLDQVDPMSRAVLSAADVVGAVNFARRQEAQPRRTAGRTPPARNAGRS